MEFEKPILLKPIAIKVIIAIAALWVIKGLQVALSWRLGIHGVYPRELEGLVGIIFAPLIHGSFEHLFSNTLALFVLSTALFYEYPKSAKWTFIIIYFGSGLGVWLFARESYHYGASGLTHGMMFFLFLIGILRRDKPAMAIAMIVFFLYGSMVWGCCPLKKKYHLKHIYLGR